MQMSMWVVLGATMALAEWVSRERQAIYSTDLKQPIVVGNFSVKLPAKWMVSNGGDSSTVLIAREPGSFGTNRTLTIRQKRVHGASTPQEFLLQSGILSGAVAPGSGDDGGDDNNDGDGTTFPGHPVHIAGWPGVMVALQRQSAVPYGMGVIARNELIACTILPSHLAVILTLETPQQGPTSLQDNADLLQRIGEQMKISGETPATREARLTLTNGLSLDVPDGFDVMPASDPNSSVRQLVMQRDDQQERLAIDLIPCVQFPNDPPDDIRTMLLLHDARLAMANLHQRDDGAWVVDNSTSDGDIPTTGARVITRPDGNSLLLIFSGAPVDGAEFNQAFATLSGDITVNNSTDYSKLQSTGASELERLSHIGLGDLLGSGGMAEQWWLISDTGNNTRIGWMHEKAGKTVKWSAEREWRMRQEKEILSINETWYGGPGLNGYDYQMKASAADDDANSGNDKMNLYAQQHTTLQNGSLQTQANFHETELHSPGNPPPAGFVPGGWLSNLIGKLSDKPMVLRSESFVDFASPIVQPMKLVVTPGGPAKSIDNGKTPLRCVSVEVSGTGEIGRWYFRPDGTLDSVDFPEGLEIVRADAGMVKTDFAADARMAP
jgi:hypothetical protein